MPVLHQDLPTISVTFTLNGRLESVVPFWVACSHAGMVVEAYQAGFPEQST